MSIYRITPRTQPENLVGRYVVRDAGMMFAAVGDAMKVIGARGKMLDVESVPRWYSETEKCWLYEKIEGAIDSAAFDRNPRSVQIRHLYLACDSLDDLNALRLQRSRAERQFDEMIKRSKRDLADMLVPGDVPEPANSVGQTVNPAITT